MTTKAETKVDLNDDVVRDPTIFENIHEIFNLIRACNDQADLLLNNIVAHSVSEPAKEPQPAQTIDHLMVEMKKDLSVLYDTLQVISDRVG